MTGKLEDYIATYIGDNGEFTAIIVATSIQEAVKFAEKRCPKGYYYEVEKI